MVIDKKLEKKIVQFCELNDINPQDYTNKLLECAFMKDMYGEKPPIKGNKSTKIIPPKIISNYSMPLETENKKNVSLDIIEDVETETEIKPKQKTSRKRKLQ